MGSRWYRPATEVTVTEESFPADSFRIVTGKTATVFDEIAGGMNESYVVRLRAKVTGTLPLPPAIVEYMDGYKQRVRGYRLCLPGTSLGPLYSLDAGHDVFLLTRSSDLLFHDRTKDRDRKCCGIPQANQFAPGT